MKFPIGAMSVGDVLDRGLKLLFARLPVFYAINLIVYTPLIIFRVFTLVIANQNPIMLMALGFVAFAITLVLQPICTAAILHVILQAFRGKNTPVGEALSFALTRFGSLLLASFLSGLIIFIGFFFCIAPGVYFAVSYVFVGQVVVAENLGGSDALGRSKGLISGHRGRVLGVILLILIAIILVSIAIGLALHFVLPNQEIVQTERGIEVKFHTLNTILNTVVGQLVNILFTSYLAVCTTLLYLDLRIRKEGLDLEMAAEDAAEQAENGDDPMSRDSLK